MVINMKHKALKNEIKKLEVELTNLALSSKGMEDAIKTISEMIPRGQTFTNFHVAYGIVINTSTLVQNIVNDKEKNHTYLEVAQIKNEQIEKIVKYAGKADEVVKQGIKPGMKVIRIIKHCLRMYFRYLLKNNELILNGDEDLKQELTIN